MSQPEPTRIRITIGAVSALVIIGAIALVIFLVYTISTSSIPFDADEANHAADGWQVYHALSRLAPGEFARAVTDQGFYPPVHSFFIAAGYALGGPSLASSRLPTAAALLLTLAGLVWLTLRLARRTAVDEASSTWLPLAGAMYALALAITSRELVVNSVLVMTEITGALLAVVLLLVVDSTDATHSNRGRWIGLIAAAVIAWLIGLTKYSFGLFYVPGLVVALLSATWPWRAGRRAWTEAAVVSALCGAGFGLWVLVTDRTSLLMFLTDHPRPAALLSAENLLFFPGAWFTQYAATPVSAVIAGLLAVVGGVCHWHRLPVRVAAWSIAAAFLSLTLARVQEARHLLPVAPAAWMLAGLGLVEVLRSLQRQAGGATKVVVAVVALFAVVVISAVQSALALPTDLTTAFEGAPALSQAQDFALTHVDLNRPVLFIGDVNDQFGLVAVRWRAATLANKNLWDLDVDYFHYEYFERGMMRTHRKPQIATVDPTFPRKNMNEVLARNYYGSVVELKHRTNYFGPRAGNPEDPLCIYGTRETWFDDWVVIVYEIEKGQKNPCVVE